MTSNFNEVFSFFVISKFLVELIQPTLNKSKYKITNSSSFVNEAKNWLVKRDQVHVSYDINLYPSVAIDKALDVLKVH